MHLYSLPARLYLRYRVTVRITRRKKHCLWNVYMRLAESWLSDMTSAHRSNSSLRQADGRSRCGPLADDFWTRTRERQAQSSAIASLEVAVSRTW